MELTQKADDKSQLEMSKMRKQMTEQGQQVKLFEQLKEFFDQTKENLQIIADPEEEQDFKDIAKEELQKVKEQIDELSEEIVEIILPKSDADQRNCTIEILQAAGGSESSLFAEDLFKMYQGYCRIMGFRATEIEF